MRQLAALRHGVFEISSDTEQLSRHTERTTHAFHSSISGRASILQVKR